MKGGNPESSSVGGLLLSGECLNDEFTFAHGIFSMNNFRYLESFTENWLTLSIGIFRDHWQGIEGPTFPFGLFFQEERVQFTMSDKLHLEKDHLTYFLWSLVAYCLNNDARVHPWSGFSTFISFIVYKIGAARFFSVIFIDSLQ